MNPPGSPTDDRRPVRRLAIAEARTPMPTEAPPGRTAREPCDPRRRSGPRRDRRPGRRAGRRASTPANGSSEGIAATIGVLLVVGLVWLGIQAINVLFLVFVAILLASGLDRRVGSMRARLPIGLGSSILLGYGVFAVVDRRRRLPGRADGGQPDRPVRDRASSVARARPRVGADAPARRSCPRP